MSRLAAYLVFALAVAWLAGWTAASAADSMTAARMDRAALVE